MFSILLILTQLFLSLVIFYWYSKYLECKIILSNINLFLSFLSVINSLYLFIHSFDCSSYYFIPVWMILTLSVLTYSSTDMVSELSNSLLFCSHPNIPFFQSNCKDSFFLYWISWPKGKSNHFNSQHLEFSLSQDVSNLGRFQSWFVLIFFYMVWKLAYLNLNMVLPFWKDFQFNVGCLSFLFFLYHFLLFFSHFQSL